MSSFQPLLLPENQKYIEMETIREVRRPEWGKINGVCLSMPTERKSVCCKELCFLSAAVRGKDMDQSIIL